MNGPAARPAASDPPRTSLVPLRGLGASWSLACLALLPAFDRSEVSRTALALLPWLMWAGWPRRGPGDEDAGAARVDRADRADRAWASSLWRTLGPGAGLWLPLLALGFELDRASGWSTADLARTLAQGAVLGALTAAASTRAAWAGERAARLYGQLWTASFLLLPTLAALVLLHGPASAAHTVRGPALAWAGWASPLAWCLGRVSAGLTRPFTFGTWAASGAPASLALALVLWIAVAARGRGARR